jgi:hypothetical protein
VITVTNEGDVVLAEKIASLCPFQLSQPSWLVPVLPKLPVEELPSMRPTREQLIKQDRRKIMAVKMIEESTAPQRLHGRGVLSSSQEYIDTLKAVREIKGGKAILVTIESPEILKQKNCEQVFAYAVRRYLAKNGVMATAYKSGPKEVVVRRAAEPPKAAKKK